MTAIPASNLPSEQDRLDALRSLQILDTSPEQEFEEIVQLAAQACGTPISLFTLVDERRQWFKAVVGLDVRETDREVSFCSQAIQQPEPLIVEDAAHDDRFHDNPLVTGAPHIRFYAGLRIEAADGQPVGTLCVIDTVPRTLDPAQKHALKILASQVQARIRWRQSDRVAANALIAAARNRTDTERGRRVEAEGSLRSLNDLLNSVLECTLDSIIAVDADWTIRYMNSKAAELPSGNVLGQPFWEIYPDLRNTIADTNLTQCMTTRVPVEYEMFYPRFGRWYRCLANPHALGVSIFFRDVTVRKELDLKLEQERLLREQRVEALSHMAGGLAHEISNPLAIVHALVSDLRDSIADGPALSSAEMLSLCEETLETADRASRILRGLRAFARDGNDEPMLRQPLTPIVKRAVQLQKERFERGLIFLEVTYRADSSEVCCRDFQILQILTNLLNNAFDAVDMANPALRSVRVIVEASASHCTVSVVDSGPGIPPETRAFLMTPFFTTKPVGAGVGVGLSLSKAIAEDHKGSLTLAAGTPTTFILSLPTQ